MTDKEQIERIESVKKQQERRDFLRKSMYAAYATPMIISMLAERANAGGPLPTGSGSNNQAEPPPPPE